MPATPFSAKPRISAATKTGGPTWDTRRASATAERSGNRSAPLMRVSMLRYFVGACVLACAVAPTFAGSPTPPDESASAPMRFEWRREGPAEACGPDCRVWISASGYITADTPREFEAFTKDPNTRGAVLVLDSDGGSVLGTLALGRGTGRWGRTIRNPERAPRGGRPPRLPPPRAGDRRATLYPNGNCESMCAFLLLAGARRYVPPQAHVLVHQIWLGKKRKQAQD